MLEALDAATKGSSKPLRTGRTHMIPSHLSPPSAAVLWGTVRAPPEGQAWERPPFAAADPGTKQNSGRGKAALEVWR